MTNNKKTIVLGLDYSTFSGGITECNRKMKLLDSEFKEISESTRKFSTESEKLELNHQNLTQKIYIQTQKVNIQKKAYDDAVASGNATSKQVDNLKIAYNREQTALDKLNNSLIENDKNLAKSKTSLDDIAKKLNLNSEQFERFKMGIIHASEALVALGVASSGMYVSFDQTFSKVKTLADTNVVSLDNLKEGVYTISKETAQSAGDVANALYECLSANVKTADALTVTEDAAKLAKAGFTEVATSVDILTTIMNSYNKSASDAQSISDMLIKTQDVGKLTVGELGSSFGKVAGLASSANISLEELLASVATITQSGMEASESVTVVKAAISNIVKPTAEASETAKQLGIQFSASALASQGFAQFLDTVKEKTGGNIEVMAKLFGSTEAVNGILQLTSEKGSKNFKSALDEITNSGGSTEDAIKSLASTGTRLADSLEVMKTTLVEVGDALSPLIDGASAVLGFISNINPKIIAIMVVIGALILIVHAVSLAMGALSAANILVSATAVAATSSMGAFLLIALAVAAVIALITGTVGSISKAMSEAENSASRITTQASNTKSAKNNYSGTNSYEGGETWIGEGGPELVTLPRGSKIHSNADSKQMMGGVENYYFNVETRNIKELNDIVAIAKNYKMMTRKGRVPNV